MKKSQLTQLVREALQGYSKYTGKTQGGTTNDFRNILTKIAKGEGVPYEGDPEKGNAILDKANQDNVDRIVRGEKPVYENESPNLEKVGEARPQGRFNEFVHVNLYKDEAGEPYIELHIYVPTGKDTKRLALGDRAKPFRECTVDGLILKLTEVGFKDVERSRAELEAFREDVANKL